MLTSKIAELKKSIIEEADLVINMMDICIQGLLERDESKLNKIFDLEEQVNDKEIAIDEACTTLIALHQPEAKNLRTILMILKMNNDLERMGDLVTNMSKCASYLVRKPSITKLVTLPKMTEAASKMVKDSIQAFIDENAEEAKCVCVKQMMKLMI
jgi:phosphate transport system protein